MSATNLDQTFFNSCVPIEYPCNVGNKLIDPCNCGKFYLCEHATSIIHQSCSAGTLFNHVTEACERAEDVVVIDKLCEIFTPWKRCEEDDNANLPELKERCTGIAPTPTPTPTPSVPPPNGQADNTGAIVGAVIGVLLVIALIVVIIFLLKKRGKPASHYLSYFKPKKNVSNPEYDNKEETYSEIRDVMGSPVYNDTMKSDNSPRLPDRPSFTMSPALQVSQGSNKFKGRPVDEDVAYDNPGYSPSADDDDVIQGTTSLNVSRSSLQPPGLRISKAEDDTDRQSTYSDLDRASIEMPVSRAYTPLSVYTRGPNPNATAGEGGIVQVRDTEYEVPKPMPEYFELQADSNCVS